VDHLVAAVQSAIFGGMVPLLLGTVLGRETRWKPQDMVCLLVCNPLFSHGDSRCRDYTD
jgi:hypothetical protein